MNKPNAAAGLRAGAWIFLLAVAMALPAGARAQSVDTGQPIVIRSSKAKIRYAKFSGRVLSADQQTIKVRSGTNYDVRTFTYAPKVSAEVAKGLAKGHYGYGQPVEIKYVPGSSVASWIRR